MNRIYNVLRRTTSSGEYISEFDSLRFIAIASVLFFHMNGYTERNLIFKQGLHCL
ncbi:MAG: hypothetical protein HOP07_01015 [Bacteriovoracaceae bacterium]|nr:hypothetical protein [Bacteriovoracaceae bacterium]